MNVLVVEDQAVVREVLIAVASSAYRGATIRAVADLEEALITAAEIPMDAVLLDLGLPGCSGIQALRRFRSAFPKVPVVVISSNEDNQVIADALEEARQATSLRRCQQPVSRPPCAALESRPPGASKPALTP